MKITRDTGYSMRFDVFQGVEATSDKEDDDNKDPYKKLDINLDA